MKIIIAYASAGAGHRKAAEALYNYFREKSPGLDIRLSDILRETNSVYKNIYVYGYRLLVNNALWLWGLLFRITSLKQFNAVKNTLILIVNRINSVKFSEFLSQEQPDVIICTHFFPAEAAAYLKRKQKIKSKIITVITDFGVHPFWVYEGIDLYIAASSFTKKLLINEGVEGQRIKEAGIPIDAKFAKKYGKSDLCEKLGVARDKFTVLITTGSFAIGPVEKIVDLLYKDVQVMVVCAGNKRLYQRLKHKNYPGLKIFGFIDNIEELMAVSDIVIAKPGGLTTCEILTMELLPIFISPIPGQETENIRALKEYGIGEFPGSPQEIKEMVLDYKAHPQKLNAAKNAIKEIKKPNASADIYDAIR